MRSHLHKLHGLLVLLVVSSLGVRDSARAICLTPPGDLTGDAATSVIDVQCQILMNLWSLAGQTGPVPMCINQPGSPAVVADQNCDGVLNVIDTLITINFALKIPLTATIDANGDQCVDACESDMDGDGDYDLADCSPHDPLVFSGASEICNGYDDNCNGSIDELADPATNLSCSDQDACNGNEVCLGLPSGLGLMITELMIAPGATSDTLGEWIELFNPTSLPININGYLLTNEAGQTHTINPGGALFVPSRGFVLLGRNGNPASNGGIIVNYVYTGFTMPNTSGKVVLLDPNLAPVDRVDYAAGAFPIVAGRSVALISPQLDNNVGANWALSTFVLPSGDTGTPRGPNRDVAQQPCGAGESPICADNNPCTTDGCEAASGCVFLHNSAPCDDNNACTVGDQCAAGICQAGGPLDCDDGVVCTVDTCGESGCVQTPVDALCDDGDPCTADSCHASTGCVHALQSGGDCAPLPGISFCAASGEPGDIVRCSLRLARATLATPPATALSFRIGYNPALVKPVRFVDDGCVVEGVCFTAAVPPANLWPSGHSFVPSPQDVGVWQGQGAASVFHAGSPTEPITPAYGTPGGGFIGDTLFVELEVELLQAVPAGQPQYLDLFDIVGATADATKLTGQMVGGVMITSLSSCVSAPTLCDDGNACTTDGCDAASGLCTHLPLQCDDGNVCNGFESCIPAAGCQQGAVLNCNDGLLCTADSCDPSTGCVNTPLDCSDGNACNGQEQCHPVFGCLAGPPLVCDDGDPCTVDACNAAAGCIVSPSTDPACLPPGVFCGVSGAAGSIHDCPVHIARLNWATPAPASAQFSVGFNPSLVRAVALIDQLCLGNGGAPPCVESAAPPAALHPSGHTVVAVPNDPASWPGTGDVVLFNADSPGQPITVAYLSGGAVWGPSEILRLRVELLAPIAEDSPAWLHLGAPKAATASAQAMTGTVSGGTIVFALADCTNTAFVCNDGDACTADSCQGGQCLNAPIECSDGNACNGLEICAPSAGCVAGAAPDCNDSNACTVDTCHPSTGCAFSAVNCDDGNACNGVEDCQPASGCHPGLALSCDDGNPCTIDACIAALGCVHSPISTPECLPNGVICWVSGSAGTEATCEIQIARASAAAPAPASAQLELTYDAGRLGPPTFEDEACLGEAGAPPCSTVQVPPSPLSPSGHQVALVPPSAASWAGLGNLVFFHGSNPGAALSSAVYTGGAAEGDALVLTAKFPLLQTIAPHAAAPVWISKAKAASAAASAMNGEVVGGVVVFQLANCNEQPDVCDDGLPCTLDVCNPPTGHCLYAPKPCSDDNACNGEEVCWPSTGECLPAFPLNCHDGDACTTDNCLPAFGCAHAPVQCDDGNPCNGIESCDSGAGCLAGIPLQCDDGDPCTIDTCTPSAGCQYAPDVESGCLPLGALCAVSGGAGQWMDCELRVARANTLVPPPASAQFTLSFPPQLQFAGLYDEVCLGEGGTEPCFDAAVPPAQLSATGHTAVLVPANLGSWAGAGNVVLFNPSSPTTALTGAIMNPGGPPADSAVARARFSILSEIGANAPVWVGLSQVKGATAAAQAMTGTVQLGTMVMNLASCIGQTAICNDGDACTHDACNPDTGLCTHTLVECDDANACNGVEQCDALVGCLAGIPPVCEDGDACTVNTCEPSQGCEFAALDCSDGDACNGHESCDSAAGCVPGVPLDCDDDEPCTLDICSPTLGCLHPALDCTDSDVCNGFETCLPGVGCSAGVALNCDDHDPCTIDICGPTVGCQHQPLLTPACLPEGAICGVAGAVGAEFDCPIRLARATESSPLPAAAQFSLQWSGAWLKPTGFWTQLCLIEGEPCIPIEAPPAGLYPGGHTVVPIPSEPAQWQSELGVAYFHPSNPTTPLSESAWVGGQLSTNAEIVTLKVQLQQHISPMQPRYLWAHSIKGADASAQALSGWVKQGTLTLGLANCALQPGVCDDNNPCTFDTCSTVTGECEYLALSCSDGNPCNGTESCEPSTGNCIAGEALDCHDGNPCTTDTCDADFGCQHIPVDCDDGNACNGAEVCGGGECMPGTPLLCSDGDACTTDACDPQSGCEFLPQLHDACLPAGAICGIVGEEGLTVECVIRMARKNAATPSLASAQLQLAWQAQGAVASGFFDTQCLGLGGTEPCFDAEAPPASLSPSGHQLALIPSSLAAWSGGGNVVFFQPPGQQTSLSDAYIVGGQVNGDADVVRLRLTLSAAAPASSPLWVWASSAVGSTPDALKLNGQAHNGVVVFSLSNCSTAPLSCDDEQPCTHDSCVGGNCAHSPVVCEDGNVCNGLEICDAAVGCVTGIPLPCDDGNACTTDSCHPVWGCTHTWVVCSDGDACNGVESCHPSQGCVAGAPPGCQDDNACTDTWCEPNTGCWIIPVVCTDGDACNGNEQCIPTIGCVAGVAPTCDDGDNCTLDSCEPTSGCAHAPSLVAECLPDGVCCGLAGQAGDSFDCPIRVARGTQEDPAPTGLQFALGYDSDRVLLLSASDSFCLGEDGEPPCFDVPLPGTLATTGHTVAFVPSHIDQWTDGGSVVIFHPASPETPISDAWWTTEGPEGDPEIFTLHLELVDDVDLLHPTWLYCHDIKGSTADATKLAGHQVNGVMVLLPVQ